MWKNFLSQTKGERRAAFVLLVLIIMTLTVYLWVTFEGDYGYDEQANASFQKEMTLFEASQHVKIKTYLPHKYFTPSQNITFSLFSFDPNTTDSVSFLRLGLKPYMAKSILKYRKKGGRYRKPEDFARVPYLSSALYQRLLPYIRIDEKLLAKRDTFVSKQPAFVRQEKYAEGTLVDLATADTTELKKIPGIASGTARSIVAYRSRLGGFYAVGQLRELKNISEEQFLKISKFLKIGELHINRIAVNRSGIERLSSHPYLSFYQAKVIVELRRKKGKINRLEELSLYEEFSSADFDRLRYYLDFT